MSANAREARRAPRRHASCRHRRRAASPADSRREVAAARRSAGAHALARLAHRRVIAVGERHGGDQARGVRRRAASSARPRRRAPAASRRRRACRPPARRAPAEGGDGWGCRCGRRRCRRPRPAPPHRRRRDRRPARAAATAARSGVEAATPEIRAPARRAERAWTRPMNPVPTMPTRSRVRPGAFCRRDAASAVEPLSSIAANLYSFCGTVKQKSAAPTLKFSQASTALFRVLDMQNRVLHWSLTADRDQPRARFGPGTCCS